MFRQLGYLSAIIFLLLLKLVLGNPDNAYNFSCFLHPNGERDNTVILHEGYSNENFTVKLELDSIIDERIKAYMDANNVFEKAQKEEKTKLKKKIPSYLILMRTDFEIKHKELQYLVDGIQKDISFLKSEKQWLERAQIAEERARIQLERKVEEIFEVFCSYILTTEKRVKVDIPSSFLENLRIMCSKKSGFQNLLIAYKELEDLNASCPSKDSCAMIRKSDSLIEYNCQCGHICSTLDTCCFDSPYRVLQPSDAPFQSCQAVYGVLGLAAFMVDKCPRNGTAGDEWETLCTYGEENNFMTYVPVTSTRTNLTYKNYYCFACHETTDDYYFWEVKVKSKKTIVTLDNGNPIIVFDPVKKKWMGQDIDELMNERVLVGVSKPSEIQHLVTECRKGVVSKCHDNWLDDITKSKCSAYTALISFKWGYYPYRTYKNPHCAICNFESLNDTYCDYITLLEYLTTDDYSRSLDFDDVIIFKFHFSYTRFFTLTPVKSCPENSIWNPFSNECSPLKCSEGYSLQNRACIPS